MSAGKVTMLLKGGLTRFLGRDVVRRDGYDGRRDARRNVVLRRRRLRDGRQHRRSLVGVAAVTERRRRVVAAAVDVVVIVVVVEVDVVVVVTRPEPELLDKRLFDVFCSKTIWTNDTCLIGSCDARHNDTQHNDIQHNCK